MCVVVGSTDVVVCSAVVVVVACAVVVVVSSVVDVMTVKKVWKSAILIADSTRAELRYADT